MHDLLVVKSSDNQSSRPPEGRAPVAIDNKDRNQVEVAATNGIAEPNLSDLLTNKQVIGVATRIKPAASFGVKPTRFVVERPAG